MSRYHNLIKHILTNEDNVTFDTGRVIAFVYFVSTIILQGYSTFKSGLFDAQSYLVGGGGFLTGLGGYLFLDKRNNREGVSKDDYNNPRPA